MINISSVTKQHNCKVLSTKNVDRLSHCRNKGNCPLNGKCLQTCVVYKADVITNKGSHIYYGAGDGEFIWVQYPQKFISQSTSRARYGIFNHIWQLKYKDINFTLKLKIVAYASTYRCASRRCNLCLTEKYVIARAD